MSLKVINRMSAAAFNARYEITRSGRAVPKRGVSRTDGCRLASLGGIDPRGPDEGWRDRVLAYRPFAGKLPPEAAICAEFWARVYRHFSAGRLRGVAFHVPNEGAFKRATAAQLAAMGKVAGTADYFFGRAGYALAMEAKLKGGVLSPRQRDFRAWCRAENVPWERFESADEGERLLVAHGFIPTTLAEVDVGDAAA